LAQRSVFVGKSFWMREVRRLCDSGHQTSVMTTRQDLSVEQIAARMFSRWSQENFFRYMRHEYSLDHLITNDVEKADGDRLVPCPRYKEKSKPKFMPLVPRRPVFGRGKNFLFNNFSMLIFWRPM
jgi:hypothetical protein